MNTRLCLLALTASLWAGHAIAERADRTQPVNIEADKVTVDERKKIHLFEGKVVLTQGTLEIRGDTLTVTQDPLACATKGRKGKKGKKKGKGKGC